MRKAILLLGIVCLLGFCGCDGAQVPNRDALPSQTASPQAAPSLARASIAPSELAEPSFTDTAAPEPTASPLPLQGQVIGLDPGHQAKGNPEKEPVAPGSSEMKNKVTSGTQGRWSGVPEYEVNLQVALMVRDLLEEQGATVVMTRCTNDVNLSNIERAQFFNAQQTDYALRLHCNGSEQTAQHGAFVIVPKEGAYKEECDEAAKILIDAFCTETGAKNMGVIAMSNQTGFNWCERMIINIEMGHMTNREEDALLTDADYQQKMAQGICNGIVQYVCG